MELNDRLKYDVIPFKTLEMSKDYEYIVLELENISKDYNKRYQNISLNFNNESFPIYFSYNSVDELKYSETIEHNHIITDCVNFKNILVEYMDLSYGSNKYKLCINFKNNEVLRNKILTLDYTLKPYYHKDGKAFIILLDYTPNIRKVKLLKLKEIIAKNKEIINYDI